MAEKKGSHGGSGISRYASMPWPIKAIFLVTTVFSLILFMMYFKGVPFAGMVLSGTTYYYLLFAVLGFNVFMGLGATRKQKNISPPWWDYLLAIALFGTLLFFLLNADKIDAGDWDTPPTTFHMILTIIIGLVSLEAGRRIGGWGFLILLGVSICYPLFADKMPGVFWGYSLSLSEVFSNFAFGADGILGLPGKMLGNLILPFYLFAGVMMGMGGGDFFLKLATALMGRVRGGPAKVAVLASGFFGSLSGSIIANIAGTGSFTIPAMKRMGYPPHYAGAIEGCASSGGDTMPPIMGGMVFMAAIIANVDYATIMIAAFLPTLLYYFGLIVQVDGYAAKMHFRGLPANEIPPVWETLKQGWIYLVCIIFLVLGLIYFRWGVITPIYAVGLMAALQLLQWLVQVVVKGMRNNGISAEANLGETLPSVGRRVENALMHTAGLINFGMAVFLAIGFIMVGLYKTGVAMAITSWIVDLGAGNVFLILFISALLNMLMGMVGLQRGSYLFLAVTMAPAVVSLTGVPIILVHLFIIFYAGLGGLTPPVAINAFVAASIAGADPMKTAWKSMRLGIVLLFVPFFFVLQPALAMQGPWQSILYHTALALGGIFVLTSGLEGYLLKVGPLFFWERVLAIIGGFMVAFPDESFTLFGIDWPSFTLTILGVVLTIIAIVMAEIRKRLDRSDGGKASNLSEYVEYPSS